VDIFRKLLIPHRRHYLFFFISLIGLINSKKLGFNRKRLTLKIEMAALSTDKVTNFMYAPWTPLESGLKIQCFFFLYTSARNLWFLNPLISGRNYTTSESSKTFFLSLMFV